MLENLSDKVRLCYERAAEAKARAEEMTDAKLRDELLNIEKRWLLLARNYEAGESLDDFAQWSSHHPDLTPHAERSLTKSREAGDVAAIRGHETDVAAILATTPFLLARCSSDLRYLFVSTACARMFGLRPEDFEGRRIVDILGEEAFRTILPYLEKVLGGEEVEYERDIYYAGVGQRRMLVKYTPERDRSGSVRGWIASILDITDQRKAEIQTAADLRAMTILSETGSLYVRKDLGTDDCLQRTMGAAITLAKADKGTLHVVDVDSNTLFIAAHHGFTEPFLSLFEHVREDAAACAVAMQTENRVIVEDVLHSEIFAGKQSRAILVDAGLRAVMATPLMSSSGTLVGILSTYYATARRPTDREIYLTDVLARQTADYLERKRAEQIEKTLVRELNHRCNNLLAVIQAIANRSLSDDYTVDEARTAFVARLHALARANRRIMKSDWSSVELRQLIDAELEPFKTSVTVEGPPVTIPPHDAQNLSLAAHELVTNASKYGALSSATGHVHVSWTITRENSSTLHFRWQERGGPRVVVPSRRGFGTTLLAGMFTGIRIDYLEEGLDCSFDLELWQNLRQPL